MGLEGYQTPYKLSEYDYTGYYTYGGPKQTIYKIQSPWNTDCELLIANLSTGSAGGYAYIADIDLANIPPLTLSNIGNAFSFTGDYGIQGFLYRYPANANIQPTRVWIPWFNHGGLYSNQEAYVTIIWRRKSKVRHLNPPVTNVHPDHAQQVHALQEQQFAAKLRENQ